MVLATTCTTYTALHAAVVGRAAGWLVQVRLPKLCHQGGLHQLVGCVILINHLKLVVVTLVMVVDFGRQPAQRSQPNSGAQIVRLLSR